MEEEQTLDVENQLVDTETYLKSGIHIGTKFRTKYMEKFIYKTRPDGLSILDIETIDERLRVLGSFVSNYNPEDILVVSRRENGWRPLRMLEKLTGIRIHAGRYSPGMLTNPRLDRYAEAKLLIVTDAWPDRNAVKDALRVGIPVVALCDTNNQANNLDLVIPCNNKGKKSLALVFYTLALQYLQHRGEIKSAEELGATLEDFADE
jgi:small subunit ribosomal protein S2